MIGPLCARIRTVLLGASAAALVALPAIPAGAQVSSSSSASLACTISSTADVHPGVTTQVHHFGAVTHGFTGTAVCTGTVDGLPVTGPGTFLANSHSVGSCASTSGVGNFVLEIPTAAGQQTVAGHFASSGSIMSPVVLLTGDLSGTSKVVSAVGNCFTTPLTQVTVVDTVQITT